jgi:hypothetical protein
VTSVSEWQLNRPNWTPCRSEIPSPITTKLNTIHNVRGNSSRAKNHHKPIKGARPTKDQHIGFLLVFPLFVSWLSAPQKLLNRFRQSISSNDSVSRKEVPFGGSYRLQKLPRGLISPKHPKIGLIGISRLNKSINNFSTVHAI